MALFPSSLLESMDLGMEVNSRVTGYNHIEVQVYTEHTYPFAKLLSYYLEMYSLQCQRFRTGLNYA